MNKLYNHKNTFLYKSLDWYSQILILLNSSLLYPSDNFSAFRRDFLRTIFSLEKSLWDPFLFYHSFLYWFLNKIVIVSFSIWQRGFYISNPQLDCQVFFWSVFAETKYAFDNILEIVNNVFNWGSSFSICLFSLIFKPLYKGITYYSNQNVNMCNIFSPKYLLQELGETLLTVD